MLKELTIDQFTEILASDSPVPGGGSASALAGATAVSLVSMVASLTIGKTGYEEYWDDMKKIKNKMEEYRLFFLEAMDKDAASYTEVMDCYKLPKNTEDERRIRIKAIQDMLYKAAVVPLEIAEKAIEVFDYARKVVKNGNKNAASDGAVAALMARTAVKGALNNVEINASSIKDLGRKAQLMDRVSVLADEADILERKVLRQVEF